MKFLVWLLVHRTCSESTRSVVSLFCLEQSMDGKVMENKLGTRSGGLKALVRRMGLHSSRSGLEDGLEAEK